MGLDVMRKDLKAAWDCVEMKSFRSALRNSLQSSYEAEVKRDKKRRIF
jgi:hypothetical protein